MTGFETGIDRAKARRAARDASNEMYVDGSIYEGMEACLVRAGRTVAHVAKYADAVEIAAAVALAKPKAQRSDEEEAATPRCGCKPEVARRVIIDHGTCGMGGCPYGGDV